MLIVFLPGFCPSDIVGRAQADMILDGVDDIRVSMATFFLEKDEAKKVGNWALYDAAKIIIVFSVLCLSVGKTGILMIRSTITFIPAYNGVSLGIQ